MNRKTEPLFEDLRGLRHRVNEAQSEIRRRIGTSVHEADRSIREHPWTTVAIAATAMFFLGMVLGSRTHSER